MPLSFIHHGAVKPFISESNRKLAVACSKAYEQVFQSKCLKVVTGASIPIAADLAHAATAIPLVIGMGLASDQIHAPNERFSLTRLEQGFYVLSTILQSLGQLR